MKITVEIPDDLHEEIRAYATRHKLPMRAIVEKGLRQLLAGQELRHEFRLKTITTKGKGLVEDLDWAAIRARCYERD